MLKRILKRLKIERALQRCHAFPAATLITIIRSEIQALRLRRRASSLAVKLVLSGALVPDRLTGARQ